MFRLGILGAGTIGYRVAQAAVNGEVPYHLSAVLELGDDKCSRMRGLHAGINCVSDFEQLLAASDVVVEAAAAAVVPSFVTAARSSGKVDKHLIIMSVGGLVDIDINADGPVIHAPSGALGGLDAIQAMAVAGLDEVTLTTRKPPAGLGMDVAEETVLFEGSARDVIAKYPKNVNVAVALSLAGIGPDRTRCRLIADPAIERNTHHVVARGAAGEIEFVSRNVPSPDNPATSYLAALSAIALLKKLASKLQVG
jgi:aspartate dehydrogenase